MAVVVKNRALQRAVIRGRLQLEDLRSSVGTLENNVEDLSVEAAVQKKTVERLRCSLDATRTVLETSIGTYREEMHRQGQILAEQNERISSLYSARFNQDFIVDFVLLMTSVWAVNTALVDIPIRTLLMIAGPDGRRKIFMRQAAKFAVLSLFLRTLRDRAVRYGLHKR
ncbi:MAG: hypothetical protein BJ554DRAFT_5315 [Olpidium bornovanus]|uniref:Uncharacterized protein n=1 Tax=Olpidium bornovanus TaxID=278681 RepID=A0A8H8DL46_9FUNG|nr:MAG: hypothetical protein BJ554DRAFT_5315 [Olpidium bornovanus]